SRRFPTASSACSAWTTPPTSTRSVRSRPPTWLVSTTARSSSSVARRSRSHAVAHSRAKRHPMTEAEQQMRAGIDRGEEAGAARRAGDAIELEIIIAEAWSLIADPELAPGHAARETLPESTGLSLPMVAWALAETLRDIEPQLVNLARRMEPPPELRAV